MVGQVEPICTVTAENESEPYPQIFRETKTKTNAKICKAQSVNQCPDVSIFSPNHAFVSV